MMGCGSGTKNTSPAALFEREPYEPCVSAKPYELVGSNFERKFIPEGHQRDDTPPKMLNGPR